MAETSAGLSAARKEEKRKTDNSVDRRKLECNDRDSGKVRADRQRILTIRNRKTSMTLRNQYEDLYMCACL
jgi:hypothetical protein